MFLPAMSGFEVLKCIRTSKGTRFLLVFVVTGYSKPEEVSAALEAGADDYLIKPFKEGVLLSRLHSLIRRREFTLEERGVYELDDLRFGPDAGVLTIEGRSVELSGKERDLLIIFLKRPNMVHTPSYLLETIWGYEDASHHALEIRITSLRKKMGDKWGSRLRAKYKMGYYLDTNLSPVV